MSEIQLQTLYGGGPQTEADWTAANPLLAQFQLGFTKDAATGAITGCKIGDGVTRWTSLGWLIDPSGGGSLSGADLIQALNDASGEADIGFTAADGCGLMIADYVEVGCQDGIGALYASPNEARIGDIYGNNNGTQVSVNDDVQTIEIKSGAVVRAGDTAGWTHGNYILIDPYGIQIVSNPYPVSGTVYLTYTDDRRSFTNGTASSVTTFYLPRNNTLNGGERIRFVKSVADGDIVIQPGDGSHSEAWLQILDPNVGGVFKDHTLSTGANGAGIGAEITLVFDKSNLTWYGLSIAGLWGN